MIDLHTHTIFSDGELIPAELARRAAVLGYRALAMTDHGDTSNLDLIIPRLRRVADDLAAEFDMTILPGIELTHIPPRQIAAAVEQARALGAKLVVLHGETIVEPVAAGTNRAGIEAGIDILSHPGLITPEDAALAAKNGVCLEITTRKSHALSNGHVARTALAAGAKLVINNDAHAPGDLVSYDMAKKIALGAGMTLDQVEQALRNSEELVARALGRN